MVLTAVVVVFAMNLLGGSPFRRDGDRTKLFVGNRFEEIWEDPAARHKIAASARRELEIDLVLLDAQKHPIGVYGRPCPDKVSVTSPVVRGGEPIGYVVACAERFARRPPPWRPFVGVGVAVFMLWAASALLSFRLSRPFHELAGVAEDLGRGRFQARARLHEQKGEAAVLGTALNDMAARPDTVAERLEVGQIAIDIKAREVKVADKRADLTGLEFDILVALARRAGRVVPRDALLEEAGRSDVVVGERTVDVHISHLRQKLGDDPRSPRLIRTVRGVGYVLARDAT